jgi:uncharacterized protein
MRCRGERPSMGIDLPALAGVLRADRGLAAKADIAAVAGQLGLHGASAVPVGDDCAAIPDGDGYLLLAMEGFMNEFVAGDPWFAGWCGLMVNLSDIAAMGGRPIAVVNAVWADGPDAAAPVLDGLAAASRTYAVPVVGGHTNLNTPQGQFAVAVLGRARHLLTSFDARPGDRLIAAIDLRGAYREPFPNWQAALDAPAERLKGDLAILPGIAESRLALACKDISGGGLVGTAAMMAEASGVAITVDVDRVPRPAGIPIERWLRSFPSFGYLLSVPPHNADAVMDRFRSRGIAAEDIGSVAAGSRVDIRQGAESQTIWDFSKAPLLGCAPVRVPA